jgi:fused signal recognition particle receptor
MFSFFKKNLSLPKRLRCAAIPAAAPPPFPTRPRLLPIEEPAQKQSWMARLKAGLSKTSNNLSILFVGAKIDDDLYDELEAALLMSDAGVEATTYLLDALKRKVKEDKLLDAAAVKAALKQLLVELLQPLQRPFELGRHTPTVMMIAGVNGAGKTTTIGKLAKHMQTHGQSVLLAAGDTFRAAAREQLMVWGQRNNITVISQASGDPAAVAFDAVQSGKAKGVDVVMVDTAGRLPTQLHLMEELKSPARDRQGHGRRTARNSAGDRRQYRAECAGAGQSLRRCAQADRPGHYQAGRHRQGRRAGRHRARPSGAGVLHRRGREDRRPAALRGCRICRSTAW